MDVALYILDLLQEQDEVDVPGLGTFFRQKGTAYYDKKSGDFFPPGLRVFFRENPVSDTRLSSFISSKKNISEDSANYFIEKYAGGIRKELETGDSFHTDKLGTFTAFGEGIKQFESTTVIPDPLTFGLIPVKEPDYVQNEPLRQDAVIEEDTVGLPETPGNNFSEMAEIESPADSQTDELTANPPFESETSPEHETVHIEDISNQSPSASDNVFEEFDQSVPLYHKNKVVEEPESDDHAETDETETDEPGPAKILLRISLVLLIASSLACAGYIYQNELKQFLIKSNILSAPVQKKAIPAVITKPRTDTIDVPDSFINQSQTTVTGFPDSTGVVSSADTLAGNVKAATYEVIGPTFKTRKQAIAFLNRMKAKKIDAHIVDSIPGLRVKVSFGTFATETAAKQHLYTIQKNVFKDSYVQSVK